MMPTARIHWLSVTMRVGEVEHVSFIIPISCVMDLLQIKLLMCINSLCCSYLKLSTSFCTVKGCTLADERGHTS